MLVEPHTGLLIGLHHNNANQGEKFEEGHTGLDHISFEVADRAALEAWMD
jgi:glyoxylase I family protein